MKRSLAIAIIAGFLLGSPFGTAARQWKPTKTKKALEYLQIQYHLPGNEFVFIQWIAPAMVDDTPQNAPARELLSKYVMISVAHARVNSLGQWEHTDPSGVAIETKGTKIQKPLSNSELPPTVSGFLTVYSKIIANGMGPLGKHMMTMVFENPGIGDCREGVFWVRYVGERFEYKTPIPGCD